jgi:hypothetical protein
MSARGRDANNPSATAQGGHDILDWQLGTADSQREINSEAAAEQSFFRASPELGMDFPERET